jgi:hypothetical protein
LQTRSRMAPLESGSSLDGAVEETVNDPTVVAEAEDLFTNPRLAWIVDALGERKGPDARRLMTNRALPDSARHDFDANDLAALEDLIEANGLSETVSPFDYDDGDGEFAPWEVGMQGWLDGRLVVLVLGPDPFSSFGYGITELPPSIGRLDALRLLDVHGSQLTELPHEIGGLSSLRELRAFGNRLSVLPDSIGNMAELEILALGQNGLTGLPDTMEHLSGLHDLFLGDNQLNELPAFLGMLPLERLDVRNATRAGSQQQLMSILASAPIEELHATPDDVGSLSGDYLARIPRLYGIPAAYAARAER